MQYPFHPVAEIFPLMQGEEFSQLVNDIQEHGLREPIWLYQKKIIDGRNRYRACTEAGVEPHFQEWDGQGSLVAFVVSLNLHRRHLNESQRALVAAKIANMRQGERTDLRSIDLRSQSDAADLLNISVPSLKRAKQVLEDGSLKMVSKVESGEIAVSTAEVLTDLDEEEQDEAIERGENFYLQKAKDIKRKRATTRMEARAAQRARAVTQNHPLAGKRYTLYTGDLLECGAQLADESVDAIVTDPPYPEEFLPVYEKLWQLARRILRPGGHCLVMCGQSHLPQILAPLTGAQYFLSEWRFLRYQWTLGYFTPGQSTQVFGRKIKSNWKPVLWLVKGKNTWEHVEDTVRSDMNDKRFHDWGQSVGGMAQLIERFTVKQSVICDPFCGGGATGVAALELERFFIGIDIDAACIQETAGRLRTVKEAA